MSRKHILMLQGVSGGPSFDQNRFIILKFDPAVANMALFHGFLCYTVDYQPRHSLMQEP